VRKCHRVLARLRRVICGAVRLDQYPAAETAQPPAAQPAPAPRPQRIRVRPRRFPSFKSLIAAAGLRPLEGWDASPAQRHRISG